jgi:MFS family permease
MEQNKSYLRPIVIIAVLCVGVMYQVNTSGFVPVMANIIGTYAPTGMNPADIGWVISLPSFFMIPGVLLNGVLVNFFRMRTVMVFSWALFGLSGAAIYFMPDFTTMLVCRAVQGFAIGLCQPSTKALPSRMYNNEHRANVLGWISMVGGIMSVIGSLIIGQLGVIDWRLGMFYILGVAAVFILLALIFVPNLPVERKDKQTKSDAPKRSFGITVWACVLAAFVIYTIGAVVQIKTSLLVPQIGAGGSVEASYVSMFQTAGIIVGGLSFGLLYKKLGRWLFPISLVVCAVMYYLFAHSQSLIEMFVWGFILSAFSIGIVMVYYINRVTYTAPRERVSTAILMVTFATYLGQVVTTPFVNFVEQNFGGAPIIGARGPEWPASVSLDAVALVFAVVSVVSVIFILATRKMKLTADEREAVPPVDDKQK